MIVWKRWLLLNMAMFGIYVNFRGVNTSKIYLWCCTLYRNVWSAIPSYHITLPLMFTQPPPKRRLGSGFIFFIFTPTWRNDPIWLWYYIIFQLGGSTTNQRISEDVQFPFPWGFLFDFQQNIHPSQLGEATLGSVRNFLDLRWLALVKPDIVEAGEGGRWKKNPSKKIICCWYLPGKVN